MDTVNHFFTKSTALNARAEYALGFLVCLWLMIAHWDALNFWLAIALFAYIDLIGTVPGLLAYHRSPNGQIARTYYVLYDVMHSAVTQGLVMITFAELFGFQWALLGIPTHLCVDRAMFNNYPKPFGLAFDPVLHPAFQRFRDDYAAFDAGAANWKAIKHASTTAVADHAV
jgi:hypothetical protein